ncbi:MAG: NUDIX hydrolase [Candidatus Micrarchaeota archaeon]
MGSILENRGANTNRGAGAIVFAEKDGQRYVLSVQRANTKKWNRQVMLGGAGHIKEKETPEVAMLRELNEELELKPREILSMKTIGQVPATREEHAGIQVSFFFGSSAV